MSETTAPRPHHIFPDADAPRPDYSRLFRLDDRICVVVGGGSGIGREGALALAAQGAHVVVADRDLAAAHATVDLGSGGLTAYELDVLDEAAVVRAAADLGDVDSLVFTAGTNVRKRILDYSGDEFDRVIGLNLRAAFDLVRAFGPGMAERGRGSIIGLSSMRAIAVEPGQGVYAATKAGLLQLLRTVAAELGPRGVRANTIAPGVVATPLTDQIRANPEWAAAYAEKNAFGRWADPSEIAGAIVFLASDASSYVTGSQLVVDAGWTAIDGRFTPAELKRRTVTDDRGRAAWVLHDHRVPQPHFDLRLEEDGVLRSWAVPKGLPTSPRQNRLAIAVGDHELDHLDYTDETKFIADTGWWEEDSRDERRFVFVLHGREHDRRYALIQTEGDGFAARGRTAWLLHLSKDQPTRREVSDPP